MQAQAHQNLINNCCHVHKYTTIMKNTSCKSCLMPFDKDPGVRESEDYCSYCFRDGKLCYEGNDLNEFKRVAYKNMRAHGTNPLAAKFYTWMIGFAPRWKKSS